MYSKTFSTPKQVLLARSEPRDICVEESSFTNPTKSVTFKDQMFIKSLLRKTLMLLNPA